MVRNSKMSRVVPAVLLAMSAGTVYGQIRITEYMYTGTNGEFVEFTNRGAAPVDMTGWSYDDDSNTPGSLSLSAFGIVAPGESVIVTDAATDVVFRTAWGLPVTVKVIAGSTQGLARNDQINLYDNNNVLVARLTYGDQNFPGTIRTQNRSGWPCAEVLGQDTISLSWNLAAVADAQNSFTSTGADIGSPGSYVHTFCGPPPTGACCELGICSGPLTEANCIASGGVYQGDGSDCASTVCPPPPTGACCEVGICSAPLSLADCNASGGVYQGDGTDCVTTNCPAPSDGIVRITEYMYSGLSGEYIEFTNLDTNPIDMTGWSYDDDSNTPGTTILGAFGIVNPGESVILTEVIAGDFIADWSLVGVDVIGGNVSNLSRNDQINLYDSGGALVDRLDYGDQTFPGTIRTQNISGWPCDDAVGANDIFRWFLSANGDAQNSYTSADGDIGNPGTFVDVNCPTCGNNIVEIGEDCDGGDCCTMTCDYAASSVVCRASTGGCDPAEACTGASANCPADAIASPGTECRPSAGECDVAEICDGTSVVCPADGFAPGGQTCRAANGDCDVAESCTGTSAACPADGFLSGNVCRMSAGDCDPAESCSGLSPNCPPDALAPNTQVCRPNNNGGCDIAENCTGSSPGCPPDGAQPNGFICRASSGAPCDVAEACNGTSAPCPPDGAAASGTPCGKSPSGPDGGPCDVADSCDGTSMLCPNGVAAAGTPCGKDPAGPDGGLCDVADSCDGVSKACANGVAAAGTPCGKAVEGACDVADSCDGVSKACVNGVAAAGTSCRTSTGACDPAESCDGANKACPADGTITSCTAVTALDGCCPSQDDCCDIDPDCDPCGIPTVSEWGLVIMALMLLVGWKVYFGRQTAIQA